MVRTRTLIGRFVWVLVLMAAAPWAPAVRAATPLVAEQVASGLTRPVFAGAPVGDSGRLFVVEKRGVIKIVDLNTLAVSTFMDIDARVGGGGTDNSEQGLLGLAFDPAFGSNGFFYVNYTDNTGDTQVSRFSVQAGNPDAGDTASELKIITIAQPEANHNAGWLAFSPSDGLLYIATGDGGGALDQHGSIGNGQDTTTLLGKILRIDVTSDGFPADPVRNYAVPPDNPFVGVAGADEIWAVGLRNPWRDSFDRTTGDLYIADVGQSDREEVDFHAAASSGGVNYGWRCMEGDICTPSCGNCGLSCVCNDPSLTLPIHTYVNTGFGGRCAITGGYVYRGGAIPDLVGTYFFADFCSDDIWSFRFDGAVISEFNDTREVELAPGGGLSIQDIVSFGEDGTGELYIIDQGNSGLGRSGQVLRIAARFVDCNSNGSADVDDVSAGTSNDCDGDGVPDECEIDSGSGAPGGPFFCTQFCAADCDVSGIPDVCEIAAGSAPDCNSNGEIDACENGTPPDLGPIDGVAGSEYGPGLVVQNTQTQFGDSTLGAVDSANGSELDVAYGAIQDGVLYLVLAGNLESNGNDLEIFIDSIAGGQNRLRGDNAVVDGDGLNRMGDSGSGNGLRFDAGFDADYWFSVSGGGTPYVLNVFYATLPTSGGGSGFLVGTGGAGTDGALGGGFDPFGIKCTIDNRNTGGVSGGTGADSGSGVTTGVELRIPLAAIGDPPGAVRVCALVNGAVHDFVSNQVLGPLGGGGNLGEPRNVNFAAIGSDQFFTVGVNPDTPVVFDCNSNGIPDECEIDAGSGAPGGPFFCVQNCDPDCNGNGLPDDCDVPGDTNGDGSADDADLVQLAGCLDGPGVAVTSMCQCMLDRDGDGDIDLADFAALQGFITAQ